MNRILFDASELQNGTSLLLEGNDERARHIRKVLKLSPGEQFRAGIVNGPGATGTLLSLERSGMVVTLELQEEPLLRPPPVRVLLSHPRPIVLKRMLKDLTTVGVEELLIFHGERGEKSYFESTLWEGEGCRRFLLEGAMQAGSTVIPAVRRYSALAPALEAALAEEAGLRPSPLLLVADEAAPREGSFFRFFAERSAPGPERVTFLAVGAERGWSDRERALLAEKGFTPLSLGDRVLRTESAALVVTTMAVAQYHRGKQNGESPR